MIQLPANPRREILYPPGVRVGHAGGPVGRYLLPVLVPASWAYQTVSNAVRSTRSADVPALPVGVTVVSVGNIEVGGSGKTPLAVYLLSEMLATDCRPVYISRGFGGISAKLGVVTVVPGIGDDFDRVIRPGVRCLRRGMPGLAAQVGDEGAMVAGRLPEVPLLFCADKRRALEVAGDVFGPTRVVLDDAFQSWGVPRTVDIVLVDGRRPFGNGWLLPAGRLREPPEALDRADFIGVGGIEDVSQLSAVRETVASVAGVRKPMFGVRRRIEILDGGATLVEGSAYAALSAIGRPDRFEAQLAGVQNGLELSFRYPDHHRYSKEDLDWISGEAGKRGIDTIVTTEKDWVKLSDLDPPGGRFAVARLTLELFGDDPLAYIKEAAD